MNNLTMRRLEAYEQNLILPLWGECFADYWEQLAMKSGRMPYEEISFAAFDGEKVVGHCGIIPYRILCKEEIFSMAGIASVAVTPAYRKQGIARELCRLAANWAKDNGFTSAPLYTAHCRVYESAGFRVLDRISSAKEIVGGKRTAALSWNRGSGLTDAEKANIIRLYEQSPAFDGKVLRDNFGTLHSWERIFAEPDFRFAAVPKMYAIKIDDTIVEMAFDADQTTVADRKRLFYQLGAQKLYLPETPVIQELLDGVETVPFSAKEVMHGECVMVQDMGEKEFHREHQVFFPVTDKF